MISQRRRLALAAVLSLAAPPHQPTTPQQLRWTVDLKPTFDLGNESEDTLMTFADLRGVSRIANGDVVVADAKYASLRYFTANGTFRRSVGRRGAGPGEFRGVFRMLRCGDSLFVQESSGPLWHVFHVNGTFRRDFSFLVPLGQLRPYSVSCNSSGLFISDGWTKPKDWKPGPHRGMIPFWFNTPDGKLKKVFAELLGHERLGEAPTSQGGGSSRPLPLGKVSVVAVGRDRAYTGTADSFAINVYDLDGHPMGMIRKPHATMRVTAADIARSNALDTAGQRPGFVRRWLRHARELKYPSTLPAYSAFVIDSDDNLWVQSYPRASDKVSHWTVFSSRGVELAQVELPYHLTVSEIGHDYVLGISQEPPDDIQHVQVYRLRRG